MSKLLKLPSGNTVTVKEAQDYTLKDRKFVLRDLNQNDLDNISDMMEVLERVIIVSIEEWSFDLIPPSIKPESLDTLKLDDMDVLNRFAKDSLTTLMPNLMDKTEGEPDPKVITPSSDA
jgi:hypothetical protein